MCTMIETGRLVGGQFFRNEGRYRLVEADEKLPRGSLSGVTALKLRNCGTIFRDTMVSAGFFYDRLFDNMGEILDFMSLTLVLGSGLLMLSVDQKPRVTRHFLMKESENMIVFDKSFDNETAMRISHPFLM